MPRAAANEADLYYEVRGTGPAVLLIMGATGDGGHLISWPIFWPTSSPS